MNIKEFSFVTTFAVCCLFAASCSDNGPSDLEQKSIRASLSVQTRAGEKLLSNELINTWWIAFADKNGVISAIVSRDAANTTAVEREEFGIGLPAGTYTAYAFANITPAELGSEAGVSFTVGDKVPDDTMSKVWKDMPNNHDKSKPVPMSGFKTVTVSTQQPTDEVAIEVVRMVGKVEITFSNSSQKDITVNSVTFGPLATGVINLFPDYTSLGGAPELLSGLGSENITYTFAGDDASRTVAAGAKDALTDFFYVRESDVTNVSPSGHFSVTVNITREGQTQEQLYALTEQLTYINRNDYISIPITFTDYVFDVDILFYPPIGGYPAVITEEREEAFYATFGTKGKFVLRPLIREAKEGSAYLQPSDYTLTVTETSDPDGILKSTTLAVDKLTGELTGELKSKLGRAVVKLSMNVKNSTGAVAHTYNKTIYIIRANK